MNLLCWNCRGLGRDFGSGRAFLVREAIPPAFLLLSETKMWERVEGFMWPLGHNGCLAVNCEGRSGGIALFWSTEHCVILKSLFPNFIDVHVKVASGI